MNLKSFLCVLGAFSASILASASSFTPQEINLQGQWMVTLEGDTARHPISLPGTTDMARLGQPDTLPVDLTKPQLLHLTRRHRYVGPAEYTRAIHIPASMADRPLTIGFERVLWLSRLLVDGRPVDGQRESLTTPHVYHIATGLSQGDHTLTLMVDNSKRYDMSVKDMAHAYTDETQTIWNGALGRMWLRADAPAKIERVRIFPDIATGTIRVETTLVRSLKSVKSAELSHRLSAPDHSAQAPVKTKVKFSGDTAVDVSTLSVGLSPALWSEFSPALYSLHTTSKSAKKADEMVTSFGMRDIAVTDNHIVLNGNRIFLRGTLECCIFPLTGVPPTDESGWEHVFDSARAWGMNHLRFHSYCPPEAAFRVADRMGFYLQIELPNWSLSVGKDPAMTKFLRDEADRISDAYGNHPSFCLMSCGNELQPDFGVLNDLTAHMKSYDPRRLYTASTFTFEKGHGSRPEPHDDFFVTQWTDRGWVRGQGVFDAEVPDFTKDYRLAADSLGAPLISHEIGQYSVYPDLKEIERYTGVLNPLNFKAIRADLEAKGLLGKADEFLRASGRLAAILYKEEIERAMKTPQFDGYQLLGLQDFPGQGTALVGLVNAFWDSKGVVAPEWFRKVAAPAVPLARIAKATWSNNETFSAGIELANYLPDSLRNATVTWRLTEGNPAEGFAGALSGNTGKVVAEGRFRSLTLPNGTVSACGVAEADLSRVSAPAKLTLTASVEGTGYSNSWNIWVYPPADAPVNDGDVFVTSSHTDALKALKDGKKVLLAPSKADVKGLESKFLPVFWSPVHFPKQAGTMGLLVDAAHPAMSCFPTDINSDWQWWRPVKQAKVLVTDSIPAVNPIIGVVDNFVNNRRLALAFEAQCGGGRLLMTSIDLLSPEADSPESRQLLRSLLAYMNSDAFSPSAEVSEADILNFINLEAADSQTTTATSIYD